MATDSWRKDMPPIHYCTHSIGPILDILDDRCVQAIGLTKSSRTSPEYGAADLEVGLFTTAPGGIIQILCGFSICRHQLFTGRCSIVAKGGSRMGGPAIPPECSGRVMRRCG